jgi:gamma-D-glutamyl-L-lysine dipeptidyl-peptidase
MFGICNLSVIPARKEPSDRSEQLTQLLFGDHFEVLHEKDGWALIKTVYDDYECWIGSKQFIPIEFQFYNELSAEPVTLSNDYIQMITHKASKISFPIVYGSVLPFFKKGKCLLGKEEYSYDGAVISPMLKADHQKVRSEIIETALMYMNAPYQWGGKAPFSIDCSGLTQMVYKLNGLRIKRDAIQQATHGDTLSFVEEAQEGDLAFFDNEEGRIVHVGIIMNDNRIIHASGKVRIDRLDHQGIFNTDTNKYSHRLRLIKNVVEEQRKA